jgi:pSer/pThr/pTyr-binding forkhead associated (FHA) protein
LLRRKEFVNPRRVTRAQPDSRFNWEDKPHESAIARLAQPGGFPDEQYTRAEAHQPMTMKVNLVVMTPGANNGRVIPITGPKFVIGRDPECQLRPASPAISKLHCGVFIRDMKVFIADMGSMNGTFVNGTQIAQETEIQTGATLKAGPLEFRVEITLPQKKSDSTPLPDALKPLAPDVPALREAVGPAAAPKSTPAQKPVAPKPTAKPTPTSTPAAPKPTTATAPKSNPASTPVPQIVEAPTPKSAPIPTADAHEDAAAYAMLLGLGDDSSESDPPSIPEGSTVMDIPAVDGLAKKEEEEKKKKKSPSGAEMSAAANDILRKYIRRTGN